MFSTSIFALKENLDIVMLKLGVDFYPFYDLSFSLIVIVAFTVPTKVLFHVIYFLLCKTILFIFYLLLFKAIVLLTSIEATGKTGCMTDEDCKPGKCCNSRKICVRRRGAAIKQQFGCMEDFDCDEGSFCSDLKI